MKRGEPGEESETHLDRQHTAEDFARRYFHDSEVKAYVSKLLREFRLDETAIEAEAFRLCAARLEDVHRIWRLNRTGATGTLVF